MPLLIASVVVAMGSLLYGMGGLNAASSSIPPSFFAALVSLFGYIPSIFAEAMSMAGRFDEPVDPPERLPMLVVVTIEEAPRSIEP